MHTLQHNQMQPTQRKTIPRKTRLQNHLKYEINKTRDNENINNNDSAQLKDPFIRLNLYKQNSFLTVELTNPKEQNKTIQIAQTSDLVPQIGLKLPIKLKKKDKKGIIVSDYYPISPKKKQQNLLQSQKGNNKILLQEQLEKIGIVKNENAYQINYPSRVGIKDKKNFLSINKQKRESPAHEQQIRLPSLSPSKDLQMTDSKGLMFVPTFRNKQSQKTKKKKRQQSENKQINFPSLSYHYKNMTQQVKSTQLEPQQNSNRNNDKSDRKIFTDKDTQRKKIKSIFDSQHALHSKKHRVDESIKRNKIQSSIQLKKNVLQIQGLDQYYKNMLKNEQNIEKIQIQQQIRKQTVEKASMKRKDRKANLSKINLIFQ